jgi:hypothetical protein
LDDAWLLHGASLPVVLRLKHDDIYAILHASVCELDDIFLKLMSGKMVAASKSPIAQTVRSIVSDAMEAKECSVL